MSSSENGKSTNMEGMIGISRKFALLNHLITRDLNNNTNAPTFSLYKKDDIATYLTDPYRYEKQLRKAVTYIYGASSHSAGSSSISLAFPILRMSYLHTILTRRPLI